MQVGELCIEGVFHRPQPGLGADWSFPRPQGHAGEAKANGLERAEAATAGALDHAASVIKELCAPSGAEAI